MISAKVIAHSIDPISREIATLAVTMPRIILAEFNTHRVFSRNSASSRAIPTKKFLDQIKNNPFIPEYWGQNQSGMKAREEIPEESKVRANKLWLEAKKSMEKKVLQFQEINLHKQITNRLLEPWFYTTVLVTSTEWNNFFKLRCHPDAQPEIKAVADSMREALKNSCPKRIEFGEWHIPFADDGGYLNGDTSYLNLLDRLKVATARCARVSYLTFDGIMDNEKDIKLHDDLKESGHWSPFEHCAQSIRPMSFWERLKSGVKFIFGGEKNIPNLQTGNFRGYRQYRKMFVGESGE